MSILITGMEMPTEEYGSMTITIYPNGSVMEYIGDIGRSLGYAVPVPPHGDLIDRDDVCYQLEKQATIDGQPRAIRRARRIVADAPTIIPAEEGE